MIAAAPVACRSCGHGYPDHDPDAGHCEAVIGGEFRPAGALPCPCAGFRWVDPNGPRVGSYREPPQAPNG